MTQQGFVGIKPEAHALLAPSTLLNRGAKSTEKALVDILVAAKLKK